MSKIVLALTLAAAQLLAVNAMAQTKGEADPAQSKAAPSAPATAAEKADAKAARKAAGTQVVKENKGGAKVGEDKGMGMAKATSKAERKEAAKMRKANAKSAMKKGEISSGEK